MNKLGKLTRSIIAQLFEEDFTKKGGGGEKGKGLTFIFFYF